MSHDPHDAYIALLRKALKAMALTARQAEP